MQEINWLTVYKMSENSSQRPWWRFQIAFFGQTKLNIQWKTEEKDKQVIATYESLEASNLGHFSRKNDSCY